MDRAAPFVMPPAGEMVGRGHACRYCGGEADAIDHVFYACRCGSSWSASVDLQRRRLAA